MEEEDQGLAILGVLRGEEDEQIGKEMEKLGEEGCWLTMTL